MKRSKLRRRAIIAAALITAAALTASLSADMGVQAQNAGDFSIRAVIPDNQIDKKKTYFDLRMEPGGGQTVQIVINNSRPEELTALVSLNAASTGRNGLIVYTEPGVRDESMNLSITDVAKLGSERVTVPPSGSAEVDIRLNMPEEPFEGVILGGIAVTPEKGGLPEAESARGVALNNIITYVIGIKLTESDAEAEPDFDLVGVEPGLVNYQTAVSAVLRNMSPRIAKDMRIKAEVRQQSSGALMGELALDRAEMAPASKGNFVIDWNGKAMSRGTYNLNMTAEYQDRTWEWSKTFAIGGEADEINKNAVGLEKSWWWVYLLCALAVIIAVSAIYWFRRKDRRRRGG